MMKKSIPTKCLVCSLVYLIFPFLTLYFVYSLDLVGVAFFLGTLYGVAVVLITYSDTFKRTIIAVLLGLLSAFALQILLVASGIPYRIILFMLRHNWWVQETGRLTTNEVAGYNFGTMFFG